MDLQQQPSTAAFLGRGALAGLAGTLLMTAFQRFVEMPVTGRSDSFAPADVAERVLRLRPRTQEGRSRLNTATHVAVGTLWGVAHGVAARRGLRGQRAVQTVFAVVYTGDVLANTALGVYRPRTWSRQDWVVDLLDKHVLAQATGAVFDRLLDPRRRG
jgi:hypothetical protein